MATSDEWSRVGFTGNPVTGNPGVVENITKELRDLGDLAGRVGSGLDTLLTKAEDGGFEGRTADALRTYVKDELKTFMANINRSFDMAADATARYARALGDSQDRAENAADTVAALERVGGQPLAENDPELTRARGEVDAETDVVQAEAKILEDALHEAARLVSRPVKKPKKSFWKRFVSTFFKVLEIVALVITLVAAVIGGPLGLVAFGLGAVLFAKALVDYATGNGNALSLGLAFLGILFPSTKGLTTLGGLARMASAGTKALSGALSASGRLLFRGGRMLFSSPGRLLSLAGQGLVRFGSGLGNRAAGGFMALPRVLSRTPAMLGSALRFMGGFARNTFRQGWSSLTRDFVESTAFVGGSTAGRLGVFTVMSLGRLTMTALLPMRYSEIARFGYRGAFRMGFIDRGMHFTSRSLGTLGRTGSLAGDLAELTGRNLDQGGNLRPFDATNTDRLAVPGTPEFNDTLDELAEISVTPVTTPRTPGFSSLTGSGTPRMPGRLDDMGGRLSTLDTLDTVGLPVGTVPGGQRLGVLNPATGRVGDDLMPPRLRTTLTMFDQVDEFGGPLTPGSPTTLLPPRSTVDQLRDLDELTGMERTATGLLKPLDDLTDLAELSLDGRLGGLTEFQVRQILDGEIDLVNVAPDGVVLRIGKTDPVDVRVRLTDEVKVDVLGPADPRVPTWNTTTGTDRLDELGIGLDDLTRLIPDTTDGSRAARDLLGLGPARTDLTAPALAKSPGFTPLTLRDIVTGGATGKLATERFQTWVRTQATQLQLDTVGRRLGELDELTDVPPLSRARAELDLSAAKIDFNQARIAFDRLGMNLDTVRRDITVMMTRVDGPAGAMPTGELRLLDDLGRPTGQWITVEPGPTVTWVLRSDAGIVPDVKVRMADGVFTVTTPEGVVTRFGADGRPTVLGDPGPVALPRLPGSGLDEVVLSAPRELDRLAFAADRSVDIQTITPAPVWRTTDETLWRIGGKRPLDQIFSEGFTVRDPLETSLDVMVRTGQPSAFLSTTTDSNLVWDGVFKFEIEASGGIDVGRTFERSMGTDAWRASGWASENEIAFPGGIASEFIRGAYRMDAQHNLLEWIPNPNFGGDNPLPELTVGPKGAGEGTSGVSALDFQGLSLDDQLRLLDQLDLGEARAFDDIGSLNGAHSLNEVGSQLDDLGYLSDEFHFDFDRFDAPAPRAETVLVDPADFAGTTGFRTEWQRTPLDDGGSMFTDRAGDIRLVFDAGEVRQFTDIRLPIGDGFVRFDADPGPGSLPRVVGQDGVPLPGGATIEPVRGALGVVTGVRVQSLDGAWVGRFDLDGTRLSEQLTLSGPVGGPLTGARLTTTFTQLPGGARSAAYRLTVPGLGDGAFGVVRLDGDLAQRLPGGFAVTDTATGGRFVLDRGGRFVDLPAEGATPIRLDVSGSATPNSTVDLSSTLNDLGRLGDSSNLGDLGRLGESGDLGDATRLGDLGDVGDLGRLGELGEVGSLNRLALPDLPRTDLTPQPSGPDARFGATVTDGAPTPVNPARFDGMRLSGADELTDLRLRVTEFPATDLAPASFRIDVMDFGAPGGPVRLENVTVTLREGGGPIITGPQGGVRRQFDALGQLEHRELPLTGTDLALRFTDDAVHPMPRVVGPDGVPVQGATLTPVRDATGTLSELTVRAPVPDADGLAAVWRFAPGGALRQQELPLTLPGIDGPAGLGVKVTITPGPGGTTTRVFELTGPSNLTGSFRLGPMDGSLAGRLPNGFTVTDTVTGARFHYDANRSLAIWDVPARDGSGFLRFTEDAAPGTPPVRLDELGDLGDFGGDLGDVARIFDRTLDEAGGVRGPLDDLDRLTGPDAPRTDALPALDEFAPGERELFDDLWNSVVQDVRTLTPEELNRVRGPGSPRTDPLSELSDLSDTELDALRARLDNIRRTDNGPLGADEPLHVPLSGVDELADLDLRVTRLPATDEAPQASYRLELADRTPGGTGPMRASDFTVELLDDSGRFAVIDRTGTTRFTLGPDGRFLGRETLLTFDGLPEGIRLSREVQLPGGRGMFRFDADAAGGAPRLLDPEGRELPGFRTELLDDGRIALVPTGKGAQPLERTVFDPAGTLLEETVAVRAKGGKVNGQYWKIDHATGKAVRLDSSGTPLTGRFDTATVEKSATGQYKLIGEGKVALFEREVLGNGHVLHLDLDRIGRARWTEFDKAGNRLRAGERIFDSDRRTFHDTLPYRWAPVDVLDVRTYTKALDGGLIRAETDAKGDWVWTRFATDGTEVLHGTREWSWTRIGYKDTYLDPASGQHAVAQRRGDVWPLDGYHGSRQYLEHPLLSGPAPGGMRANPLTHTAVGPNNKPIDFVDELTEELAQLADGGTLHVARISDQRLPAAAWYPRAGHGRFDGFFRNLVTGDSMFQVSKWTETASDGTKLKGVRLAAHGGRGWQDIDQFGRIVRETRTLENGNVIEVGRSVGAAKQWAPAPKWDGTATSYELPWLDTKTGTSGTRHVAADGGFEDVFAGPDGSELLAMRSQGTGVREYLAENPARGLGADDVSGVWVDKNTQLQTTGRRDHWGDLFIESHGDPRKDRWTWTATGPDGEVTEGIRVQNRGSLVQTRTWDDSFIDFEKLPNGRRGDAIRERNVTGDGSVRVDATRQSGGTWSWQKTDVDGTIHSKGVRTYQDLAKGRWSDHIGTDVVRFRNGGRVREYAYTVHEAVVPPPVETGRVTLSDLLSRSARHFEPDVSATVNREVWQEFDMGKVLHRRDPVEGFEGRFRESESLWNQWREYQDGRLVAQRTITGRVWGTDAFGRWSNFDIAKLPEISSLPKVGGDVGLDGHRSWRLIGREVDFRGYTTELRGINREFRDVFHEIWTGVEDGSSAAMPMWRHQLRKAVTDFTMGYLIEFGTSFAVSAITADLGGTRFDPTTALQRAALNGAIGGGIRVGVNVAYDTTRLGYVKYGLTNLDQGQDWHRHPLASSDDWDGEWTVFENPTRWRSGSYDFFSNLGVGVLTGFVNNAVNAAVFGVNGQKRTGLEALEAGAWGAAGSAFAGITSGLFRYTWHATAGSRIFHRGGPGELIWQAAEALGAGTLNYGLNNKDTANIQPSRAFPPAGSTPTTPAAPAPAPPQPLTIDPAPLPDGTELL